MITRQGLALVEFTASEHRFWVEVREGADPLKEDEFVMRKELGRRMLMHYFQWAPAEDIREQWKPKMTEVEFEVHLMNAVINKVEYEVFYQGRVDLLMEDKWGHYWIWDHKTAASFGNTDWLEMDEQGGSYIWALQKKLHIPIRGVVYNRLLKASPEPPKELVKGGLSVNKQQRTTEPVFRQAILDHNLPIAPYIEFLALLKERGNPFFQRLPVHRNEREIDLLEEQIKLEAIDMIADPSIYPNPGMFNCMGCAYRSPCLAMNDGSSHQLILDGNFVKRSVSA